MPGEMKKCPFCGEEIKTEAIKCRFCGEMLDGTTSAQDYSRFMPPGFKSCQNCGKMIPEAETVCRFCSKSALHSEPSAPYQEEDAPDGWYLQENGKITGPWQKYIIEAKCKSHRIDNEAQVWRKGFPGWLPLSASGFNAGPPPLTGNAVNNTAFWFLAFAPIWGEFVCRICTGFMQVSMTGEYLSKLSGHGLTELSGLLRFAGNESANTLQDIIKCGIASMDVEAFSTMVKTVGIFTNTNINTSGLSGAGYVIFLLINSILCVWDSKIVETSGYREKRVSPWWCLLIPVYMFRRAKVMKSGWICFWIWIAAIFLSVFLADPFATEFFKLICLN